MRNKREKQKLNYRGGEVGTRADILDRLQIGVQGYHRGAKKLRGV